MMAHGDKMSFHSGEITKINDDNIVTKYGTSTSLIRPMTIQIITIQDQNHPRQPTTKWSKKIQKEWKILQKDLPDTIYVRVYESRMDLLRAVIVGVKETPYHDGLFFFDIHFPKKYPDKPLKVHYHSGGLRINPNLYENGRVCLSLLNTWVGAENEQWTLGVLTMLQVLVSIQGMVLNAKPYINEPGFSGSRITTYGEKKSKAYNERTLVLSLKTMVYTMNKPPKNFEDLVIGHFRDHAHGILTALQAYMGNEVESTINKGKKKTGSKKFKHDIKGYMKTLVMAFQTIGVEGVRVGKGTALAANEAIPQHTTPPLPFGTQIPEKSDHQKAVEYENERVLAAKRKAQAAKDRAVGKRAATEGTS
ncbi:ubiquitin-conjugating enzyme 25 [Tanacetum coccineum]|uniref:Ubiquitin-conjugating enzyme 25 n=1 Tax=Tanacetum coccineum TaxID=301880 RepID=A0ABQ4Z7G9_9ASTR